LYLYIDALDGNKVKLMCPGDNACDTWRVWTILGSAPTLGQWYEYTVYWDLPVSTPNGRIDVWLDGVQVLHAVVQTETYVPYWTPYNYILTGPYDYHHVYGDGHKLRTDDLWDCGCKIVGNVTPTPPPTPTP